MAKVVLVLTVLLLGHSFCTSAQSTETTPSTQTTPTTYFLVLQTPKRRIKFYEGSRINFKLTGEKKRYSGTIKTINKRSIVFWDTEIALRDISQIKIPSRSRGSKAVYKIGNLLQKAGGLFTLVGGANYILLPDDKENGRVTFTAGLSAYVVGRSLQGFRKRTYKINKNRKLKTYPL